MLLQNQQPGPGAETYSVCKNLGTVMCYENAQAVRPKEPHPIRARAQLRRPCPALKTRLAGSFLGQSFARPMTTLMAACPLTKKRAPRPELRPGRFNSVAGDYELGLFEAI